MLKGLAQHARPGLQVDQRVVHGPAAGDAGNAPAEIDALMDRVPVRDAHLAFPAPEAVWR